MRKRCREDETRGAVAKTRCEVGENESAEERAKIDVGAGRKKEGANKKIKRPTRNRVEAKSRAEPVTSGGAGETRSGEGVGGVAEQ